MTNDSPYRRSWETYRHAGWEGTLPLPFNEKSPPPDGYTGRYGDMPNGTTCAAWAFDAGLGYAEGNICLRLPRGVLGLDVDQYVKNGQVKTGLETLRELEAELGPLPPAPRSSARDGEGGIRFFRVPMDVEAWAGGAGDGIELISFFHRYAVVWPSTNPDAGGALYRWTDDRIPRLDELPDLPAAWVARLRREAPGARVKVTEPEVDAWWSAVSGGSACGPVEAVLSRALAAFGTGASRYDTMVGAQHALVQYAGEGHRGVPTALAQLRAGYAVATTGERRDTDAEWRRAAAGEMRMVMHAHPAPLVGDPCGQPGTLKRDFFSALSAETEPESALPDIDELPALLAGAGDPRAEARRVAGLAVAAGLDEATLQGYADHLKTYGGLPRRDFDALRAEVRRAEKTRERDEAVAEMTREGTELPNPGAPMGVARRVVEMLGGNRHAWKWWRGDWYQWMGTHWARLDESVVRGALYTITEHAWYRAADGDGESKIKPWNPNPSKINALSDALGTGVLQHIHPEVRCIATTNAVLDLAADGTVTLHEHTKERFNLHALPFAYDAGADAIQWLAFLDSVLPGDTQAHALLQEWFGYVIGGTTEQHKMLSLVGPPRCGKGTVSRVLDALLGEQNVASPSLEKLGSHFGEQSLIGKTLATMSDVRWKSRDAAGAVPVLLAVIGEDAREIPRKNQTDWHGKLGVRFMAMSNDVPVFSDASGALANRMMHIEFHESFLGREDMALTGKLLTELPGILNWAIEGLRRLRAQGRFTVPVSSGDLAEEVRKAASPYYAFVDAWCEIDPLAEETAADVAQAYKAWCVAEGRTRDEQTAASISRGIRSAYHVVTSKRRGKANTVMLVGLRLLRKGFVSVTQQPQPGHFSMN